MRILPLLCATVLITAMTNEQDRGRELSAAWQTLSPLAGSRAVSRVTDAYPLSDQRNQGGWVKYGPMSDEFNGSRLDTGKWWPNNPTWKGRQPAFFSPGNVTVQGGMLHLAMRKEEPPEGLKGEGYHDYSSAAVQSKELVKYGYFEAMRSAGSSAFWFYHQAPDRWTEIDVFEIGGRAPGKERKLHITVHVFKTPEEKEHWQIHDAWNAPADLDEDFHVYGLDWDPKELRFYFDGALVRRGPNTHWHQPLTLNFDSETMPDWFGLPRDSDLPSTYSIEYVRAWKKTGGASAL
jgi:beta-glucanase (GH16 family)